MTVRTFLVALFKSTNSIISLAEWQRTCAQAYQSVIADLSAEEKASTEAAIIDELEVLSEDPKLVRAPLARMRTAISEGEKVHSFFYNSIHPCSRL